MTLDGSLTFVGFGFGPIQAGLFLYEAFRSGNFRRLVVGEVMPDVVRSVREEGGFFRLNIAHADRIESVRLGPAELDDPGVEKDRRKLVEAVAEASEIATAVPSVRFYRNDSPGSIHRILAQGLALRARRGGGAGGRPVAIYAAENHNRAAEILQEAVLSETPPDARDWVRDSARFLNTVIGKMSGVILDPGGASGRLATLTPRDPRAFLVEKFNRILVSRIAFPESTFRRGIQVFEEKDDLLPFEEAKLYGHNGAHALAAYLAARLGLERMEELRGVPGAVPFVRAAFLEESGAALIRKWKGTDALFTEEGYRAYVDDLLERMLNPWLGDLVDRVARDPERKLGWDDRLVGTIRVALSQGIVPWRFALGAAAALAVSRPAIGSRLARPDAVRGEARTALDEIWRAAAPDPAEREKVFRVIEGGLDDLGRWASTGDPPFAGR